MKESFSTKAINLPYSTKKEVIQSYIGRENIFHKELKVLLERIFDDAYVEILQGPEEKGKDLVVRKQNAFGQYEHYAFVVKAVDKLSGSATGKTAELVIQIQQAFKTPAQLLDIHEEVHISKVYVINTGTISAGAKRNILSLIDETTYKNNLDFFDIATLIKQFEDYYPEFYFSKELRHFFKDRIDKIESFLINEKELKAFIDPNIKKFSKTKKEIITAQQTGNDLKQIGEQLFGHKETFQSFLKIIVSDATDKILLTGDAGSGKSVLLFKIILEFINRFLKEHNLVNINDKTILSLPVLFRASDLKNGKLDNFNNIVETFYSESKENKVKTIIIDGVDEVSKELRIQIKEKVEAYVTLQSHKITMVFSSRTNFTIIDEFDDYDHYELLAYEASKAIEYIKSMASKQNILLSNLEKNIHELEGQIPFYPLALKLLIDVVEEHKEVPASITELYSKYIAMTLGEYSFNSNSDIDKLFEPKVKNEFLNSLAYDVFFKNNKVKVNCEEYTLYIKAYIKRHAFITDEESFKESIKRTSIIKVEENDVYFSHKSFLDYFIANYFKDNKEDLVDEDEFDKIFDLYNFVEQWEDVVFFYFGLKRKINKNEMSKLLASIEKTENTFERTLNSFYLGRLIQYAWHTESDFKLQIISNGMKTALALKNEFHLMYKKAFDMETPKILSSINMFHMIDLCYSSVFLRSEVLKLIEQTKNDESEIYFSILYMLHNAKHLEKSFIDTHIGRLLPIIQEMKNLEHTILLTMLIDFFKEKGSLELTDELDEKINKMIAKQKKSFPDIFTRLLTIKKNDFKKLRNELMK